MLGMDETVVSGVAPERKAAGVTGVLARTHLDANNVDCGTSNTTFSLLLPKAFLQGFKLLHPVFRSLSDEHNTQFFTANRGKTNEIYHLLWSNLSLTPSSPPAHTNLTHMRQEALLQQVFSSPALA